MIINFMLELILMLSLILFNDGLREKNAQIYKIKNIKEYQKVMSLSILGMRLKELAITFWLSEGFVVCNEIPILSHWDWSLSVSSIDISP